MEYKVIFSSRKTISLSIKDGDVIIKAPFGTSNERIQRMIVSHLDWIDKHVRLERERNDRFASLTDEDIAGLKKLARQVLTYKVACYANIMGLKYGRITITSAKTRFGSCSGKGNLSFSYRLMLYPEEAIDYVVVHELAHLVEMNHSLRFYRIVGGVLPDYKSRIKLLKN